jgi:hypothetical protein
VKSLCTLTASGLTWESINLVPEDSYITVCKATGTDSIENEQEEMEREEIQPLLPCLVYKQTFVALSEDFVISLTHANEKNCKISCLYAMAVHCCTVYYAIKTPLTLSL